MKHQVSKDLVLEKFHQANEQMEGIMILSMIHNISRYNYIAAIELSLSLWYLFFSHRSI